jgi:tetratricopeptide (TPR) repeat protein/archaellum component FlaC
MKALLVVRTGSVVFLGAALLATPARADKYDDAHRRISDLEERTRVLGAEFRDAPPPDANAGDRRVLDAELLFNLKNYNEAATICLDVIEKYPNSRAYDDAIVLLGESLYQDKNLQSARHYFAKAIEKNSGSRKEQSALQRLVEIALRTNDYDNVETYLSRLERIPSDRLEPSVPYVRGKYLYFRDKPEDALAIFNAMPPTNPYYLQSKYFVGTIQVKKNDLAGALMSFDAVLRVQPRNEADKDVQDLARLAIGRLYYERGQFDKAREAYASVPRQSKYFADAMYEATWNAIKGKDYVAAYRSLDIMLLQNPDSPQAPELRILRGNLHLRLANFFLASESFSQTREEFEPIYRQLQDNIAKSKTDPTYFEALLGKGLEKFDIAVFVPANAVRWVRSEPDVARMIALADDVGGLQKDISDSERTIVRLERAVNGEGKVGIFPDLAAARGKSTEILNQLVDIRRRFGGQMRSLIGGSLSGPDRAALDQIGVERASLEEELKNLPLSADALSKREKTAKESLSDLDARASEFNVQIQAMDAELVAIEQYYIRSRAEQRIRPEDLKGPVSELRHEVEQMRGSLERVRNDITEAMREFGTAGAAAASERNSTVRLAALMKREQDIIMRARGQLGGGAQRDLDVINGILGRVDGVQARLLEFDGRVDAVADRRLTTIKERIVAEKTELAAVGGKLGGVLNESQTVGGGLAQAMLGKVTDRFYDIVVQSDVGLVDVSWGLKDQKSTNLSKLINQQKLELKGVEDDFRSLLEEEK